MFHFPLGLLEVIASQGSWIAAPVVDRGSQSRSGESLPSCGVVNSDNANAHNMDGYSSGSQDIGEFDLHAYVDWELNQSSEARIAEYIRSNPTAAARVLAYRRQNFAFCLLFDADESRRSNAVDLNLGRSAASLNRALGARIVLYIASAVLLAFIVACFGAWLSAYRL